MKKRLLGYVVGSRGKKTLKMLLKKIKHILCVGYATDKWKMYKVVNQEKNWFNQKKELLR